MEKRSVKLTIMRIRLGECCMKVVIQCINYISNYHESVMLKHIIQATAVDLTGLKLVNYTL